MLTTIIMGFSSLSLITTNAYGWIGGTSNTISSGRPIINRVNKNGPSTNFRNVFTVLSSSTNDEIDDDGTKTINTNKVTSTDSMSGSGPSVSLNSNNNADTTQSEIDFMSVHDIPWAEMDPLHEILFDEYESMYLQGKEAAVVNDKFNTKKLEGPNCDSSYESVMTEWLDSVPTLNHISVVGRVGNPPEARYFDNPLEGNNNKPNVVVQLSLALPRYYSAWEREQYGIEYGQEETEWYNLEIWGTLAEFALKNVEKGARIGVVGSISTDYYRNKETDLLSTNPKLLVQDLDILESKMEADARRNKNNYNYNSNNGSNNGNNSYGSGGGGNFNSNRNYNSNNNNNNGNGQQREQQQPTFFTADEDDDDDDDDTYDPTRGSGSAGGFFDPI